MLNSAILSMKGVEALVSFLNSVLMFVVMVFVGKFIFGNSRNKNIYSRKKLQFFLLFLKKVILKENFRLICLKITRIFLYIDSLVFGSTAFGTCW